MSPNQFQVKASFAGQQRASNARLSLGTHELTIHTSKGSDNNTTTAQVPYSCIYGYEAPNDKAVIAEQDRNKAVVVVHYVAFNGPNLRNPSAAKRTTAQFLFERTEDADRFTQTARDLGAFPKPRRILLLVNPNGGVGKAKRISDTVVKPMLQHSGLTVKEQYTEYGRHAVDIAAKVDLDEVDSLVVVSGDGVLHEVINGLLSRPDWDRARNTSIGIVPAGSGNAIAASLGIVSQFVATLAAIRGETSKLDIFSLSQLNRPRIYSMLSFSWGMMADADIESDNYRWLGPLRFDVAGFIRMIRLRRYSGKVYVLPPKYEQTPSTTEQQLTPPQSPSHKREPESRFQHLLDSNTKEPPKPWSLIPNMPFYSMLLLLNCPNVGETIFFTNTIRFNDGIMRLWYSAETRFWKILMPFLFDQQNGKMVERDLMKDLECGGILIVPGVEGKPDDPSTHTAIDPNWIISPSAKSQGIYQKPGLFDVDGEVMPTARTLIEIHPSLMNILVPEWWYHKDDDNTTARAHESAVIQATKTQQKVCSTFGGVSVVATAVAVVAAAVFLSVNGHSPVDFLQSTLHL
ncbi:Sphingosine kinase 1 [Linnemannia schmuckeri]|uniref:Sphingosine kinase 1 n=1 Tax=Linnemannia schmuckeri TaxID=64567 RepID=A0A9P5RQS6_9FUNG|nr:Sphingosine kinase 1 [Linnemannia schmuckeri]